MRLRSLLAVLGLGIGGCGKAGCARPSAYATLADARGAVVFAPDDRTVVMRTSSSVSAYDVQTRSVVWKYEPQIADGGVSFSPRGKHLVLFGPPDASPPVAVLRADGTRLLERSLGSATGSGRLGLHYARDGRENPDLVAVSDDGLFVATGYFSVDVFRTGDGGRAFSDNLAKMVEKVDGGVSTIGFQPGSHRFAFDLGRTMTSVGVVDDESGEWRMSATFEDCSAPQWSEAGLFFRSARGIELWNGKTRRTIVADSVGDWAASPDGQYVARWDGWTTESTVRVWKVDGPAEPMFLHQEPSRTLLVGFQTGERFRLFTSAGDWVDLEMPSGKLLRRVSFGVVTESSRALFTDGVNIHMNYLPTMSSNGRVLAVNTPRDANDQNGTILYVME